MIKNRTHIAGRFAIAQATIVGDNVMFLDSQSSLENAPLTATYIHTGSTIVHQGAFIGASASIRLAP